MLKTSLLASFVVCAGACASAPHVDPNAPIGRPTSPQSAYTDPGGAFQVDFFSSPSSIVESKTDEGVKFPAFNTTGSITGYALGAKSDKRGQLLFSTTISFTDGKTPEGLCKTLMPGMFKKMADKLTMTPAENAADPEIQQHKTPGIFSMTTESPSVEGKSEVKGLLHVICDERAAGRVVALTLASLAGTEADPLNRWFICSLRLPGDVTTCPWRMR